MASLDEASSDDEGLLASINIIPFVDIVLVLLVIFMLTSATIVKAQHQGGAAQGGQRRRQGRDDPEPSSTPRPAS